jgi:hypothetical protein
LQLFCTNIFILFQPINYLAAHPKLTKSNT